MNGVDVLMVFGCCDGEQKEGTVFVGAGIFFQGDTVRYVGKSLQVGNNLVVAEVPFAGLGAEKGKTASSRPRSDTMNSQQTVVGEPVSRSFAAPGN